jgi:hypothetical protein
LPSDTPESIRRDIEIIQRELPLDIVEWAILTPLPGSEDHTRMWRRGDAMDGNLNNYDFEHVVSDHPRMSRVEWQAIYKEAWTRYYSPAHVETLLKRGAAAGVPLLSLVKALVPFIHMAPVENIHPLQAGLFRRKHPSERRYGLPSVSPWTFYSDHIANTIARNLKLAGTVFRILRLKRRIVRDPRRRSYIDIALTPVVDDDATLDLLTKTSGAKAAIDHLKKVAALTH